MNLTELTPTNAWQAERSNYIGGSDAAAILGESEYSTPLQVWMRKKGLQPPLESTPIMNFGHYFEPQLAAYFEQETGFKTRKVNTPYSHPKNDFLRANIDRQVLAGKGLGSTAVLELKTTTSHRMKSLDDEIPREWYLQIQHYLGITGYEKAFLQIYERDTCYFHEPQIIDRNSDLIDEMTQKLVHWWNTFMRSEGRRPEPSNGEDTLILYPESKPESVVEATPSSYALFNELQEIRAKKADMESMEEHLKTKLKDKIGMAERLVLAGKTLVSWKSTSQNRLDTTAIRKAHPELCKSFIKQTQTRRFTVH